MKYMGIVNLTPDSFSDGSRYNDSMHALVHAKKLIEEGADILDVGGESTHPGYEMISVEEEISRLKMALKDIVALGKPVSVDTYKSKVADFALSQGATILNDIWGFQYDEDMAKVASNAQSYSILMHNQVSKEYSEDIVLAMKKFFDCSIEIALRAGLKEDKIILDPGIGFGKTHEHNWEVLRRLREIVDFGFPVLLGTSKKGFYGTLLGNPVDERVIPTVVTGVLAYMDGVEYLRIHNVKEQIDAIKVLEKTRYDKVTD